MEEGGKKNRTLLLANLTARVFFLLPLKTRLCCGWAGKV
jgi:hypothetical protein